MLQKHSSWVILAICLSLLPAKTQGQAIPYIVTEKTSTSGTSGTAVQVFHDRYLPTTPSQSSPQGELAFPTSQAGSRLTDSNSTTAYVGMFTRYTNGTAYAVPGYDAALTTTLPGSPASVHRVVGTVSASFIIDTSTSYSNGGSTSFRSVASVNGSAFWGAASAPGDGIIYLPSASVSQSYTQIAPDAGRQVRIFNNTLFYSNGAGTTSNSGIFLVGSVGSLPTTATTVTQLPGTGTSGGVASNSTGFYLFDNPLNSNNWNSTTFNTLYVADDRTDTNGGIQRWVYNGTTWILSGTMNSLSGVRGLTAMIDTTGASPVVSLWSTTAATSDNSLIYFQDTLTSSSGAFGSVITLANAGPGNMFRSVELGIVVPEPSTYLLLIATATVVTYWRLSRRKKPEAKPIETKDDPTSTIFLPSL